MNIYQIGVWQTTYVKYEIEADSEEEARDLLGMGDQTPKDSEIVNWEIVDVEEREA